MPNTAAPLKEFQDAFAAALLQADGRCTNESVVASLVGQAGFHVYRNTMIKGCIDALQANYPAVARLVGEEWFRDAAAVFVRDHLPRKPSLVDYDDRFAGFLEAFEPATELPYLAGVARLDRFWTEAHVSADAQAVPAAAIAALDEDRLARAVLAPHPSARWCFEPMPIHSIWRRNREYATSDTPAGVMWQAEGALIVRAGMSVESFAIGAAEVAFLDACGRGRPLGDAAVAALEAEHGADLGSVMARLLRAGAFGRLEIPNIDQEKDV